MLDRALQYASRGWSIFRIAPGTKLPVRGSHGFLDATTDVPTVEKWWAETPQANIALRTGRIVVIDPDGRSALERLLAIGAPHGGWPRTLTAKTPRSIHLYYLAPAGVEIRSYNEPRSVKGADGIDIKGLSGYVLLPGSLVKKGKQVSEYTWLLDAPIAELPQWAVEWINTLKGVKEQTGNNLFASTTLPAYLASKTGTNNEQKQSVTRKASNSLGTEWSPREEQRVREALAAIPAEGYDRWVQCGMALASLDWERGDGSSIAFDLFNEWSSTKPDLYSLDATEKKWASFGRRSGITLGTLYHLAEQHGWIGSLPAAAPEPFNPFGEPQHVNGHASATAMLPEALTAPSAEHPLIKLNEKYCCIGDVGGKCLVLGFVPSKVDPAIEVPSFQTFKSFAERFGNRYVMVDKENKDGSTVSEPKQLGAHWLKWQRRRSYDGIDLDPAAGPLIPGNVLNLWRGFATPPARGSWERMKAHIAEVLADSDAAAVDYIMRWSAWTVQHPGERAESALVFRGGKGSGKGTFAHALRRMFGSHGLHISNPKHLVGAFNAHLRSCLLLYADEAFWAGDKQGESTLKALITESTLTIEQ